MAERKAFVTGGTGFLGLNLIEELIGRGWRVTALHRPTSDLAYLERFDVERVEGDVLDEGSLRRGMPQRVDAVFHVAANTSYWSGHNEAQTRANVKGTHSVVTVALEKGAGRLVHTSTVVAYGLHRGKIDEEVEQQGQLSRINYLMTKATAETIVRWGIDKGLDATIMNPANIVGPYDRRGWARVIELVHRGRLPGIPPGRASFCYSREVARAHVNAAESSLELVGGENYLLGGVDAGYREFVRTIGKVTHRKVPWLVTPYPLLWLMARREERRARRELAETGSVTSVPALTPEIARVVASTMTCDSSKAERDLEYRGGEVSLERMVEESFRWLEAEGLL